MNGLCECGCGQKTNVITTTDRGKNRICQDYGKKNRITLHLGESLDFFKAMPDSSATLVITSPPYNIGKIYENKKSLDDYLAEQEMKYPTLEDLIREYIREEIGNR